MRIFVYAIALVGALGLSACGGSKQQAPVGTQPAPASQPSSGFLETPRIDHDWAKKGTNDEQRARDTESCYYSARALTAHDQRIESDIDAGRTNSSQIGQTRDFTNSLNRYEERNREIRLFNECMRAKGYQPTVGAQQDSQ